MNINKEFIQYFQHNKNWHEEDAEYKLKIIRNIIDKNTLNFNSCADVGCGSGGILNLLSNVYPNIKFTGYDIHDELEKFWKNNKKLNLNFNKKHIMEIKNYYDLILCIDVFEHVEDYIGFLKTLKNKSKYHIFNIPLDMCALKVFGKGMSNARENVGHLHYFNKFTAISTLNDCNYKIIDFKLNPGFMFEKNRNFLQKIFLLPRYFFYFISPNIAAELLGGISLTVLTKNENQK